MDISAIFQTRGGFCLVAYLSPFSKNNFLVNRIQYGMEGVCWWHLLSMMFFVGSICWTSCWHWNVRMDIYWKSN